MNKQLVKDPDRFLERKDAADWLRGVAENIEAGHPEDLVKINVNAIFRRWEEIEASYAKQGRSVVRASLQMPDSTE